MTALLGDGTIADNDDFRCISDGGNTVANDDGCALVYIFF